jgi:hypothetical protein
VTVPKIRPRPLPSKEFPVCYSLISLPCAAVQSELVTDI